MSGPGAHVVLVTGLSGAGKATVLRTLEDLGYETVDNPPLDMLEALVHDERQRGPSVRLAIGIDARSRRFDAAQVEAAIDRLRARAGVRLELVFVEADDEVLLGRFSETRRRHPLAPLGRVIEGIAAERELTAPLKSASDVVIDTTGTKLADLRHAIEEKFGASAAARLSVTVISFAFPKGLPRDADMVFDARFLRNPHYDPILRERTGLDPDVAAFVAKDPDFHPFMSHVTGLLGFLLPRFLHEGKRYATIAVGCTGGKHRSVSIAEDLGRFLLDFGPARERIAVRVVHRELAGISDMIAASNHSLGISRQTAGLDRQPKTEDAAAGIRHRSAGTQL